MKIGIAADHAGFELKQNLSGILHQAGVDLVDFGATSFDPNDDYPDFVIPLAEAVRRKDVERGIAICGSGVGASVVANKVPGVRAGLCHDTYSAHQGVEHDDVNMLIVGSRVIGSELAREIVEAFLKARFTGEARHVRRLSKLEKLEERYSKG